MLSYWVLRDRNDAPVGLVRVENDRVLLTPTAALSCEFRVFSAAADLPLAPFSEARLANAEAVLGTEHGALCAFAAAPDAKPAQTYLKKLSQIYTIEVAEKQTASEPDPIPPAPEADAAPHANEPQNMQTLPDVSDTARETEAFSVLLEQANAFYARFDRSIPPTVDNMVHKEDNRDAGAPRGIDLFPQVFPGARWRYKDGADILAHYEGEYTRPNGARMKILAVPGRCAPRPPRTLPGFTRFLRAEDGTGYWLRMIPPGP